MTEERASFHYEAFISYRHKDLDIAVAKAIHKQLETYHIPSYISKKTGKKRMGKVFRDQDELPLLADLGEGIRLALEQSEWLIVICSPDLPQSKWCMAEVDYFIKLGRRDKILTVLISGEPAESFPPQLRYIEGADGEAAEREPLAADVRAETLGKTLAKVKQEKLRLLAPMLGVGYDDLKRRQRERFLRTVIGVSAAAATFFAIFGAYVVRQNLLLQDQMAQTEEQRQIAQAQRNTALSSQSLFLSDLSGQELAKNNLIYASLLALEALPENTAEPDRPLLPEAEYALRTADAYLASSPFTQAASYDFEGIAAGVAVSGDGNTVLVSTKDGWIYLYDSKTQAQKLHFFAAGEGKNVLRFFETLRFFDNDTKIIALHHESFYVWDAATGEELACVQMASVITSMDIYEKDGKGRILIIPEKKAACLYDLELNLVAALSRPDFSPTLSLGELLLKTGDATGAVGSRYVYTGYRDGAVYVWSAEDGQLLDEYTSFHDGRVTSLQYCETEDAAYLMSVSGDRVRLGDAETLDYVTGVSGTDIKSAWFFPRAKRIGVGFGRSFKLYDIEDDDKLADYEVYSELCLAVERADGCLLFISPNYGDYGDGQMQWQKLDEGIVYLRVPAVSGALSWNPDSEMVLAMFAGQAGRLTGYRQMPQDSFESYTLSIPSEKHPIRRLLSPDGNHMAFLFSGGPDYVFDIGSGSVKPLVIDDSASSVYREAGFSEDSRYFWLAGGKAAPLVWDIAQGVKADWKQAAGQVASCGSVSPDGTRYLLYGFEGRGDNIRGVSEYSMHTGELLRTMDVGCNGGAWYSPDGAYLYVWSTSGSCSVFHNTDWSQAFKMVFPGNWHSLSRESMRYLEVDPWERSLAMHNLETGEKMWDCTTPEYEIVEYNLSGDGARVAVLNGLGQVLLLDGETGALLNTIPLHLRVKSVRFGPVPDLLYVSTKDDRLELWSIQTGKPIVSYNGEGYGSPSIIDISQDGTLVLSGGTDFLTVCLWRFSPLQDVITRTQSWLNGRVFTEAERAQFFLTDK